MKIPFTCEGTLNQLKSAARILCQFWMGWSTVQEAKIFNLKQELCTLHLHVKQHQRLWYKVDRTLWFLHHLKISVTFNLLHHIITWWKIPKFHTFVIRPWHKHMVIELQACDSIRMITKGEKSLSRFQTPYLITKWVIIRATTKWSVSLWLLFGNFLSSSFSTFWYFKCISGHY